MVANPLQTFGRRSVPPCGDCDSDGECTMNCGPVKKAEYSYTGTEDGDFVIWKGEKFVANVGGAALAQVGKKQVAFDLDKEHAELFVTAVNERHTLLARVLELEAERDAANARAERARIDALEEAALEVETKGFSMIDCNPKWGPFTVQDKATDSAIEECAKLIRALKEAGK